MYTYIMCICRKEGEMLFCDQDVVKILTPAPRPSMHRVPIQFAPYHCNGTGTIRKTAFTLNPKPKTLTIATVPSAKKLLQVVTE